MYLSIHGGGQDPTDGKQAYKKLKEGKTTSNMYE